MSKKNAVRHASRRRLAAWSCFGPIFPLAIVLVANEPVWSIAVLSALSVLCVVNASWFGCDAAPFDAERRRANGANWVVIVALFLLGSGGALVVLLFPLYPNETPQALAVSGAGVFLLLILHHLSFSWHVHRRYSLSSVAAVTLSGMQFGLIALGADCRPFAVIALWSCAFAVFVLIFIPFWKHLRSTAAPR